MKLKETKKLLNELVKVTPNPKDFITGVMALQKQTAEDVVQNVDMTVAHFHVTLSYINKGHKAGPTVAYKIAKGLDIDPVLLYRIMADWEMLNYIKKTEVC